MGSKTIPADSGVVIQKSPNDVESEIARRLAEIKNKEAEIAALRERLTIGNQSGQ